MPPRSSPLSSSVNGRSKRNRNRLSDTNGTVTDSSTTKGSKELVSDNRDSKEPSQSPSLNSVSLKGTANDTESDTSSSGGPRRYPRLARLKSQEATKKIQNMLSGGLGGPISFKNEREKPTSLLLGVVQKGGTKEFVEPNLAQPSPAYTGLPMEEFPNAKIKRESLWGPGKKKHWRSKVGTGSKSNGGTETGTGTGTSADGESELELLLNLLKVSSPAPEDKYINSLQTDKSEWLSSPSAIREPLSVPTTSSVQLTPRQVVTFTRTFLDLSKIGNSPEEHRTKRIKVISPKKPASTNLAPNNMSTSTNTISNEGFDDDSTGENDDFCTTCGGSGVFICCETCPKSFHFTCCEPPLEELPEDNWNCHECLAKMKDVQNWNSIGIFGKLLNQLETRNPKEFILPENLRNQTFIGVSTGVNGSYQDSTSKPELTARQVQQQNQQIAGFNRNNDLEIENLYDKTTGSPHLCYKCGLSGLGHKTLAHCDYCPLVWHIDCLSPPLLTPKTIGSKWRCPNHVLPITMLGRRFVDTGVVDVSLQNHFLEIQRASNFLIQQDDQPYIKDMSEVELKDYLEYQNEVYKSGNGNNNSNNSNNNTKSKSINAENGNDEVHPDFKVPDYLRVSSYSTNGISATPNNSKLRKLIVASNEDEDTGAFIYRVPERLILLDFILKAYKVKETRKEIMDNIEHYENKSRLETNPEDEMVVEGLSRIKRTGIDFEELVRVATREKSNIQQEQPENILDSSELSDLLRIKKLIELKGRESMLKFLTESG